MGGDRDRDKDKQKETETEIETETDRQADRQTETEKRQRDRNRDILGETDGDRQRGGREGPVHFQGLQNLNVSHNMYFQ